jgi:hypothetical protein
MSLRMEGEAWVIRCLKLDDWGAGLDANLFERACTTKYSTLLEPQLVRGEPLPASSRLGLGSLSSSPWSHARVPQLHVQRN